MERTMADIAKTAKEQIASPTIHVGVRAIRSKYVRICALWSCPAVQAIL